MPLDLARNASFLTNALTLAHLADATYQANEQPEHSAAFKKTVFTEASSFGDSDTETFGYVTANEKHVVLAFRGTTQAMNWVTNLNAVMRHEGRLGARVHQGFARAIDAVWNDLFALLRQLWVNGQTFWITGHSLGGALATLTARWLSAAWKPYGVYTFGQPRVGDADFAEGYTENHHRFVNNRDIVPTVPPRFPPFYFRPLSFYTHVKRLQFFDGRGNLVTRSEEELGLLPEVMDALSPLSRTETRAEALILDGVEDHKLSNYIACIEQNLPA
jgi:triacylglycerol lipase